MEPESINKYNGPERSRPLFVKGMYNQYQNKPFGLNFQIVNALAYFLFLYKLTNRC